MVDPKKTTPYEFYQYWRNVDDSKVEECLCLLTFLPMDEVRRLGALEDAEINKAKEVLAFEITKIVHGEVLATEAMEAAKALFTGGAKGGSIPTTAVTKDEFEGDGMDIISALIKAKLVPTRSEGRRMVQQGGVRVNDVKVEGIDRMVTDVDFTEDGTILLKKGKKGYHQFQLEQ